MNNYTKFDPNIPPPPLMTGEPDSFAHKTMITRIPAVIDNVLADYANQYSPEIKQGLQRLRSEVMADKPVQLLPLTTFDANQWTDAWAAYPQATWLNCPWYLAEAYFYRRLLAAVNYFGPGAWAGVDPYHFRKSAELKADNPWQLLTSALKHSDHNSSDSLGRLLHYGVWGNRLDLSYAKVAEGAAGGIALEQEQANLLVDDTATVLGHLESTAGYQIEFICDNAGDELLMDLALADFLLRFKWAGQVTLHVKAYPTFVSDATTADVRQTIAACQAQAAVELQQFAARLAEQQNNGRLRIESDPFWNSHHFFWELPPHLQTKLGHAQLVIIKGDANYRRLLGDSRWPAVVPLVAAVPYFPAPFVALRTMKSDPVVGLQPGQAEALNQTDPEWRVNGQRGLIQAVV